MKTRVFQHPDLDNPLFVRTDHMVTSVRVEETPGHDVVTVWNRGGCAGTLTLDQGDGERFARQLLGAHSKVTITT